VTEPGKQQGRERRKHERHQINLKKTLATALGEMPVMDISWGGISFFSESMQSVGADIEFFVSDSPREISTRAKVLGCDRVEGDEADPDHPFRVRCQFLDEPDSPEIMALMEYVLDQEGIGGEIDAAPEATPEAFEPHLQEDDYLEEEEE